MYIQLGAKQQTSWPGGVSIWHVMVGNAHSLAQELTDGSFEFRTSPLPEARPLRKSSPGA